MATKHLDLCPLGFLRCKAALFPAPVARNGWADDASLQNMRMELAWRPLAGATLRVRLSGCRRPGRIPVENSLKESNCTHFCTASAATERPKHGCPPLPPSETVGFTQFRDPGAPSAPGAAQGNPP